MIKNIICLLLMGITFTAGAVLVVDHAGSGSYTTIAAGAAAAAAGDTVLVKDGAYDERITIDQSGTAGQPIVIKAENKHGASCRGFVVTGDYVTIDGLEIWAFTLDIPDYGHELDGIRAGGASNLTAVNNYIRDLPRGVGIWSGPYAIVKDNLMERVYLGFRTARNSLVENNRVVDLTEFLGKVWDRFGGFAFFGGDSIIYRGNFFWNDTLKGDFFRTWDGGNVGPSSDILIEGNICFGAKHASEPDADTKGQSTRWTYRNNLFMNTFYVGIYPKNITAVKVYNNTFINCGVYPVRINDGSGNSEIKNNIMAWYDDSRLCPWPDKTPTVISAGVTVENNLVFNHTWYNQSLTGPQIEGDPKFVDPVYTLTDSLTADFRLQAGSPAIDAALDMGLTADLEGTARPQGSAPDIGAYEYKP